MPVATSLPLNGPFTRQTLSRFFYAILIAAAWLNAHAQSAPPPQPIPREGSCPSGYYASDKYCVPTSSAKFAIKREGSCPSGYYGSDKYCVAATDSAKAVIPRAGRVEGSKRDSNGVT